MLREINYTGFDVRLEQVLGHGSLDLDSGLTIIENHILFSQRLLLFVRVTWQMYPGPGACLRSFVFPT